MEKLDSFLEEAFQKKLDRRQLLKRAAALGLSAPVIAGLLAACGAEQGGTSGNPTSPPAASTQAPAGAPTTASSNSGGGSIKIGYLTSYTGEMGAFGVPWFNAAKMAVDEINAAGGVLGKQIDLITEDDQSSVEQGIRGARKLITTNGVIVIGGPISDVLLAILDFATQNKVVVWSPAAGTTKLDQMTGSYHFRTVPSDSYDGKVAAHVLWEKGFKNIGMLFENDEGRLSISGVVKAEFEKLGGAVVISEPFNPKQTTYSAELKSVYDKKPDAVWIGAGQESSPVLLKDWSQRGYGGQLMVASDIAVPQIFDLVGKQIMEGILTEMPSADENSAQYQRFAKKFRELYNAEPGGGFQSNSYDGMILTALAIQAAGEATGEAVANNLQKVANPPGTVVTTFADGVAELKKGNDINYEGASGPVDFDQYNNVSGSYASMIAKDGQWVQDKFYPAGSLG